MKNRYEEILPAKYAAQIVMMLADGTINKTVARELVDGYIAFQLYKNGNDNQRSSGTDC